MSSVRRLSQLKAYDIKPSHSAECHRINMMTLVMRRYSENMKIVSEKMRVFAHGFLSHLDVYTQFF